MSDQTRTDEARLLTAAEKEAVSLTEHPAITGLSRQDLLALARRLREARDRARDIARQQRREMRGKSEARGARAARDDTGTIAKEQLLAEAVRRISKQLRHLRAAAPASARAPFAPKPSGGPPAGSGGRKVVTTRPSSQEARAKPSKLLRVPVHRER